MIMVTVVKIAAGIILAWVVILVSALVLAGIVTAGVSEQLTEQAVPVQSFDVTEIDKVINQFEVPTQDAMQQPGILEIQVEPVSEYDRVKSEFCNSLDSYIAKHHCIWTEGKYESMKKISMQNNTTTTQ
jgi:hypothetical protein